MKPSLLIAVLAMLVLALTACGGGDGDGAGDAATTAGPAPASASQRPIIGIGEQGAAMFKDTRFTDLGVKHVRLVVPYDATRTRIERDLVTVWLAGARRTGAEPFITFGHSRKTPGKLPSVAEYRAAFRSFRRMFPEGQVYAPWNEINHNSQPTSRAPRRAAQYYNAMKAECPACVVLAGDVLDQPGMVRYLRQYQRHLTGDPAIWGLHNYADTNRFRSRGLREMLATVKGEVWLTETGGLVRRDNGSTTDIPEGPRHAGEVTRFIFDRLLPRNPRVTRVYLYHWNAGPPKTTWDSGLITPGGRERSALFVLARVLRFGLRPGADFHSGSAP